MKTKNLFIFSLSMAIICAAIRTATILYTTESTTGFFTARLAPLGIGLSIAVFLLTLVTFLFALSADKKASLSFAPSKITGLLSAVCGIVTLLYPVLNTADSLIKWQNNLTLVFSFLCGLWFLFFGISAFIDVKIPPILNTVPLFYYLMRLVLVFTAFSSSALVAEHVFSLAYRCTLLVFMLTFLRLYAGYPSKRTFKIFLPISVSAFILSFTSVISRLIVHFCAGDSFIHGDVPIDYDGITLCLIILPIAYDALTNVKEEKENDL